MDSKTMIDESIRSYKKLVDNMRPYGSSTSLYRINKPWGYEIWLELNEFYTYKIIHINKGHRASLQSHNFKLETIYIISGSAEILLEDENGNLNSRICECGDGWTVLPNRKHRTTAITDYTAVEVSTSQLDDIIRYHDDNNRESGKIEKEHEI